MSWINIKGSVKNVMKRNVSVFSGEWRVLTLHNRFRFLSRFRNRCRFRSQIAESLIRVSSLY